MGIIFLTLSTLCLLAIVKIISVLYQYFVLRRKISHIPNLGSYCFIGDSIRLIGMTELQRMQWYIECVKSFPKGIFVFWFGIKPVIHINRPEYLEIILPSTVHTSKDIPYNLMNPWVGKGLLTSSGKKWFHDRRLIGPTFHFSILDQFTVIFSEKAEILTKCLEKAIEKNPEKPIDIFPFALNAALDIICETAMGVNINAQEAVTNHYTSTVRRASKLTIDRMYQPWYWIDWLYYLTTAGKEYKSLLRILHGFTNEVIRKKKATRLQSENGYSNPKNEEDESNISEKQKRKAFLDLLLDQNEKDDTPLSDDELRAQVDTFMFEGHDTTAVALTWVLFCLGNSLEHQEKVHEELEEVFKDSQTPASIKEISQLKYLDRVIKEALRLFPSVPIIARHLTESVKIDEYMLPKDTLISLSIFLTHRKPDIWPDPVKFDPDRFLPENSKHRNPYAYIPFSAGPRNCIGQRFAQLEEKILLTAILRKWRIKSVKSIEEIEFGGSLILRPYEEVFLHFTLKK